MSNFNSLANGRPLLLALRRTTEHERLPQISRSLITAGGGGAGCFRFTNYSTFTSCIVRASRGDRGAIATDRFRGRAVACCDVASGFFSSWCTDRRRSVGRRLSRRAVARGRVLTVRSTGGGSTAVRRAVGSAHCHDGRDLCANGFDLSPDPPA